MNYVEFNEKKSRYRKEIFQDFEKILNSLNEKFSEFIGKKVIISLPERKIRGKVNIPSEEYIGYFNGFVGNYANFTIDVNFRDIKKDGKMSAYRHIIYLSDSEIDNLDIKLKE